MGNELFCQNNLCGEIFNLGSGVNFSINEVAAIYTKKAAIYSESAIFHDPDALENALRQSGSVVYLPQRPGEATETLADISFTKAALGWEPTRSLPEYIEQVVQDAL